MPEIRHETIETNGIRLHVARSGHGKPLVLLHGWPEYWLTWEPVMSRLADRYELIAPDLRGFGASEKPHPDPSDKAGASVHAADCVALLDALGITRAGFVSHDLGAYVAQVLGRRVPERVAGLFFFDCPYPGIGPRLARPDRLAEIWYQSFHLMPYAAELVGSSRKACRIYIGNILRHWSGGNPNAFDDVLEDFVDNFMQPGNLQGGFNWYISAQEGQLATIRGESPDQAPITVPACVRWGDRDPLFPLEWTDRLGETFADLDLAPLEGVGHFPHREQPDLAADEIARFFGRLSRT